VSIKIYLLKDYVSLAWKGRQFNLHATLEGFENAGFTGIKCFPTWNFAREILKHNNNRPFWMYLCLWKTRAGKLVTRCYRFRKAPAVWKCFLSNTKAQSRSFQIPPVRFWEKLCFHDWLVWMVDRRNKAAKCLHSKTKTQSWHFQIHPGWRAFSRSCSCDGLMWTIGLSIEIKLLLKFLSFSLVWMRPYIVSVFFWLNFVLTVTKFHGFIMSINCSEKRVKTHQQYG